MIKKYVPARLFVRNLMIYCGMNVTQLQSKINDEVKSDIRGYISTLSFIIEKDSKPGSTVFTPSFINEYENLLNNLGSSKKPDYCLFRKFYENLKNLVQLIGHKRTPGCVNIKGVTYSDRDFLNMYDQLYEEYEVANSEAVSLKELKRVLEPFGNKYNDNQLKIIKYTFGVFTYSIMEKYAELSESIDNNDYLKLFFFDLNTQTQKIFVNGNTEQSQNIENLLKLRFSELLINDQQMLEIKLIGIFEKLIELYNQNILISSPIDSFSSVSNDIQNHSFDYSEEDHDALISSCILNFISWLPVCDNNATLDLLSAVTDVINDIREPLEKSLSHNSLYGILINGDLFISNNNMVQRKILVKALNNNVFFRNQFNDFYRM